jgi:hypothetical protein
MVAREQSLHLFYDLRRRRRLLNNGRCGPLSVGSIAACIEKEGDAPRLELATQQIAPAVKNGGSEMRMVDQWQCGAGIVGQQDLSPFCLKSMSDGAADNPASLND